MTKGESEKYQIIEQGLSEALATKINNLLEGFCREHKCKVNPVVFYAPAFMGQPAVVSNVEFQCVTDEHLTQIQRERNPQIITAPKPVGRLVN